MTRTVVMILPPTITAWPVVQPVSLFVGEGTRIGVGLAAWVGVTVAVGVGEGVSVTVAVAVGVDVTPGPTAVPVAGWKNWGYLHSVKTASTKNRITPATQTP